MTDVQKQAYEDYIKGVKYSDIAAKYDVPLSTVKTWANRYFKKKQVSNETAETVETSKGETVQPAPRKKGGQPGNDNAETHGAYSGFFADILTDDELGVMNERDPDPEQECIEEIKILTIREKRLLVQIAKYSKNQSDGEDNDILTSVTRIAGERSETQKKEVIKDTNAAYLYLKVLEEQLTKVQNAKIKCVAELARIRTAGDGSSDIDKIVIDFKR